jgi:hypothetical protein
MTVLVRTTVNVDESNEGATFGTELEKVCRVTGKRHIESIPAKVVTFARRKPVQIDSELKAFLDECVIPLLIRGAMMIESTAQKVLESDPPAVPNFTDRLDRPKDIR